MFEKTDEDTISEQSVGINQRENNEERISGILTIRAEYGDYTQFKKYEDFNQFRKLRSRKNVK